jgi:aryl-alcohol dehydrogenase-like predicted oxidoreductase
MRYRLLGTSGLRVSELVLGTMTFGEDWGWGASKTESQAMFEAFAEAGGTFVDTANNYTDGTSERYLGEFVAADRDHFVLATKYTLSERKGDLNFGGNHRKNLFRSLKASLERLGSDHVDLLWLHMWDDTTPVEEVMRALDDVVRMGLVHYVGISDTPAWVVSRANMLAELRGWSPFVAVQASYSLLNRDLERELLPMARRLGLAVSPWGSLAGGVLTGKYRRAEGATRYHRDRVSEQRLVVGDAVVALADELGRSPAQVALNWVRQQPGVILPLLGARSAEHLRDNLACLDFELDADQLARLSAASPIELGFPKGFLTSDGVRDLAFGDAFAHLDRGDAEY